ncbi:L-amino acid amidase [Hyphodiscus hymeniophilus]|uniref:L-amino acid amidase n=1 Tax=Hyphodiscus hymeniophilus TaxID=353542 RepID=A0A9P6SL24_9HELO|nr:L-amino acid amidase [Hyphodiscus hymeniophilus]
MATPIEGSYDGLAPFHWPAARKPLQTWYRIFGDLSSSVAPLVIIHGGPGFPHNYLLNHRALTDTYSVPVIFYDQIGSGLSTRLPETASSTDFPDFWTVEIFNKQLRQLLVHLKIEGRYDILGSSWGGMMGSHFAHTRPAGLRRLILANSAATKSLSIANRKRFREQLPREIQDVLDRVEKEDAWNSEEAGGVMMEFARRHACTVFPFPEDMMASIRIGGEDTTACYTIGEDLNGNPFKSGGYMGEWTMVGKAAMIEVPTLLINGIDEFASGDAMKPFLDEIPDVRLITMEGTSHSPHVEKKEEYMKIVGDFLAAL